MTRSRTEERRPPCASCTGTGELGTDVGVVDCPDCGGVGFLPDASVLVEWRARDIERAHAHRVDPVGADLRWLLSELRRARRALTEVVTLAEEGAGDSVLPQIRVKAGEALSLFEVTSPAVSARH